MNKERFLYHIEPLTAFISSLFFGNRCISCKKLIFAFSKDRFCSECRNYVEVFKDNLFYGKDGEILIASAPYASVWRKSLLNFKFGGEKAAGYFFSDVLAENIKRNIDVSEIDGILFVPCFNLKNGKRYNQSEILARRISVILDIPIFNYLKKKKDIKSQTACKNSAERLLNIEGVYTLSSDGRKNVAGKTFLLIDDITTTGATLISCGKVLKNCGAKKIIYAVSAKTMFNYRHKPFILSPGNSDGESVILKRKWKKPADFEKAARKRLDKTSLYSLFLRRNSGKM